MFDSWDQVTKFIIHDSNVIYGQFLNQTEILVLESFIRNSKNYYQLREDLMNYNIRIWNTLYKHTFGNLEWMKQYDMINYL